jgi:hypothetical protein
LLTYKEIENSFGQIVVCWYELRKKMSAVMYNFDLYLSNSFLMLTEALEIYIGIISQEDPDPILKQKMERVDEICETLEKKSFLN